MTRAHIEEFRCAIAATGLTVPDVVVDDGLLHKFSTNGRPSDRAGWYVLHADAIPAGVFGCWRSLPTTSWCAKADTAMTPAELSAHRQRIQAMRAQRDADEADRLKSEANKAAARWKAAAPADPSHAYLARKRVQAHGIRQDGSMLLVPLRDTNSALHSLQTITADGDKRFKGRMKGCYHAIGKTNGRWLLIVEGYATAATVFEATGLPVAVAFNADNLMAVALALHRAYPALALVLCADDDWLTEGNPGVSKARQAAMAVGGVVVVPQFPAGRPATATDFNDLFLMAGLGAVRACFAELEGFYAD